MSIALLFPGQASQKVGMGQELMTQSSQARLIMDQADAAYGGGLASLIADGPQQTLTLTANAQPALVATCISAWTALRTALPDLKIDFAAGHSLGEFSALVAAGALPFDAAIPLVRDRGNFMQEAVPPGIGAMAACLGTVEATRALVAAVDDALGVCEIANYNGPSQTVISGNTEAITQAIAIAKEHGIGRARPLEVSAPFHCSLMEPARLQFAERVNAIQFSSFAYPIITNLEATPNTDPARLPQILTDQITSPVRFTEICQYLIDQGCRTFIECGPGGVLTAILKRGWKDAGLTLLTVSDAASLTKTCEALNSQVAA